MFIFWREGVLWFGLFAVVETAFAWLLGVNGAGAVAFLGAVTLTRWAVIRSGAEPDFTTVALSGLFAYLALLLPFLALYGVGCGAMVLIKPGEVVAQCDGNRWLYVYPAYHLVLHILAFGLTVLGYRSWKWGAR